MHEVAIPAGMKPWAGGDSAPEDWDGGPVMIRDGSVYLHNNHPAGRWLHGQQRVKYYPHRVDLDIIAYTPRTPTPASEDAAGLREAVYVIRRHGAFFRPNAEGYTTHIGSAGLYTREEADKYSDVEGVTIGRLTDWQEEVLAVLKGADRLRAALHSPAEISAEVDTVAFVQGWLMNTDYDPSQFDRDFAAAIDARCATSLPTTEATGAGEREAVLRQALEDVCNPLGYLQRMAEAEGNRLGGMAYTIANDIATVQGIARDALADGGSR